MKYLAITLLAFFSTFKTYADVIKPDQRPITLQGKINGGKFGHDSLIVFFTPSVMSTYSEALSDGRIKIVVQPDTNGNFYVKLPTTNEIGSLHLSIHGDENILGSKILNMLNTRYAQYYIEPGDSINMAITIQGEGKVYNRISGRGAAKFLAINSLSKIMEIRPENNVKSDHQTAFREMERFFEGTSIRLEAAHSLLKYYKSELTDSIYDLIFADIHGKEFLQVVYKISDQYTSLNKDVLKSLFTTFLPANDSNLSPRSPFYTNYKIYREILAFKIRIGSPKYSITDIYNSLQYEKNVQLKEKLMVTYLMNVLFRLGEEKKDINQYTECLNNAYNSIQNRRFKKAILAKSSKFQTGSPAKNFDLTDAKGKRVQLTDFKGKVVLIDIYGTVCSGCRFFATTLKSSVFDEFKGNKDIVFIAISVEPNKDVWLKNIEDGHNTSKEHEIILYTNGLGMKHPYITYHEIQAVPTLLLIDKNGKIANSSSDSLLALSSGPDVVRMIREQLNRR
ncbi:TlpA family protein disulfide reductase [Pedobacter hiemivivus]|uniref:TlpA family protein disulfide reductase n=1 Tax=Pedobacter hiemivivus TaxID=2530454 RepID=A0A4U1GEK1_9SPHI|nr:TlpA disulfide reductase family protein [Pedobacter hiemivivus]TKC62517.1 TlpA family protein disulfide reductase [Pedobacter hiemivivus]